MNEVPTWPWMATIVLPLVVTAVGVLIGFSVDQAISRRRTRRADNRRLRQAAATKESGGILYETRDTARHVMSCLENQRPLGWGLRTPTKEGLIHLLNSGSYPDEIGARSTSTWLGLLAGGASALNDVLVNRIGQLVPLDDPANQEIHELAQTVFDDARLLIRALLNEPMQSHRRDVVE